MHREKRGREFYILAFFFAVFVLFLYGPLSAILILAFQGPNGGLTFPLNGVSLHWFGNLFEQQAVGDFGGSFRRSFALGLMVMVVTVLVFAGRPCLPSQIHRRDAAVLSVGRQPGGAFHHHIPWHWCFVSAAWA